MGEAEHRPAARRGEGIERGRLHLDREDAGVHRRVDRLCRLAEGCVRGPAGADLHRDAGLAERLPAQAHQARVCLAVVCGRQIVIAGALVAQRAIDDDEVGRRLGRQDLARRGYAEEEPAAGSEQLLRHQHREGGPDDAADDADLVTIDLEGVEVGMVAGPARVLAGASRRQ